MLGVSVCLDVTQGICIEAERNIERGVVRQNRMRCVLAVTLIRKTRGHGPTFFVSTGARSQELPLRPDLETDWLELLAPIDAPLRQAVVALQRGQTRSPAQALSNDTLQLRHIRCKRTVATPLGSSSWSDSLRKRKAPCAIGHFLRPARSPEPRLARPVAC
jgi:hypothetical protein